MNNLISRLFDAAEALPKDEASLPMLATLVSAALRADPNSAKSNRRFVKIVSADDSLIAYLASVPGKHRSASFNADVEEIISQCSPDVASLLREVQEHCRTTKVKL